MKNVQIIQEGNTIDIWGSNQFRDLLTSARCWPKNGFHAGCYDAAVYLLKTVKIDYCKPVILRGHSFGGGVAQILAVLLRANSVDVSLETTGAYPVQIGNIEQQGVNRIYGNDPVPSLFPWFKFIGDKNFEGPARKWWKINFKDHLRY